MPPVTYTRNVVSQPAWSKDRPLHPALAAKIRTPASRCSVGDQLRLREALEDAIERDDADDIKSLVHRGASLLPVYYHRPGILACTISKVGYVNPVDVAALALRFRAAMQLLELGDSVFQHSDQSHRMCKVDVAGHTKHAVNVAASFGHLGLLRMLLERGAPVYQQNLSDESALLTALRQSKDEVVELLVQWGALTSESHLHEVLKLAMAQKVQCVLDVIGVTATDLSTSGHDRGSKERTLSTTDGTAEQSRVDGGVDGLRGNRTGKRDVAITHVVEFEGGKVFPSHHHPRVPSITARRNAWFREDMPTRVYEEGRDGVQVAQNIADGFASWSWSPIHIVPTTALSAASGGAAAIKSPRLLQSPHELSSGDVRLRGELRRAITKGEVPRLNALVARGAPLDAAFDLGYGSTGTCVDLACCLGKAAVAMALIKCAEERGCGKPLAEASGASLFWAVTGGHLEVLRALLTLGARVDQRVGRQDAESLLGVAVVGCRSAEALELLRFGAWDAESDESKEKLMENAKLQTPIAAAFQQAGILAEEKPLCSSAFEPLQDKAMFQKLHHEGNGLLGTVKTNSFSKGFGLISCPETFAVHGVDVHFPFHCLESSNHWVGECIGKNVRFDFIKTHHGSSEGDESYLLATRVEMI